MAIVVFQHNAEVGPGRLGATLRDHGYRLDIRRLDRAESRVNPHVPADFDNVEGVVSLGGSANVTELAQHAWMAREVEYLKEAHRRQLPLVGVCLGHQLIAHALAGEVGPAARSEHGFTRVHIEVPGQTDVILAGIPWESPQFQCHNQEVTAPPPGAAVLASSEACRVQAFRVGLRTYGFQYHFEWDRAMIEALHRPDRDGAGRPACMNADDLSRQLDSSYNMFARTADRLCVNLASFLFPMRVRLSA